MQEELNGSSGLGVYRIYRSTAKHICNEQKYLDETSISSLGHKESMLIGLSRWKPLK